MSALAPIVGMLKGIIAGIAVIGIAYIAAALVIKARTPDFKKRRFYVQGLHLAAITLMVGWAWLYVTRLN